MSNRYKVMPTSSGGAFHMLEDDDHIALEALFNELAGMAVAMGGTEPAARIINILDQNAWRCRLENRSEREQEMLDEAQELEANARKIRDAAAKLKEPSKPRAKPIKLSTAFKVTK